MILVLAPCFITCSGYTHFIILEWKLRLVNGQWRYFRSCAYLGEPGIEGDERFCLMRTGTYNIFMEYCTCNSKDGCNSALAGTVPASIWYLVSACLLVWRIPFVVRVLW
uniref:(California timema) hypothetical protein n=1 Tax=Timema californicum TaxID=61474 RepID=A0A7R9JCA6_TIMCA|nr:unnamed protein product [Timema californicum]